MAQSIHNFSNRKDKPFVAINCAALPESLLESELFGYEKGTFTGASDNGKLGLFEQANKGTIFLDEIGDMSLHLQARLLRVLQEKQIMRLGSDKVINIDIRIIAATNKNLREAMEQKTFREDLYYRLSNIPIIIPPLRQRKEDIPYLMSDFLHDDICKLTAQEQDALQNYHWPGNVRELKNAAEYYLLLGELPEQIISKGKSYKKTFDAFGATPSDTIGSGAISSKDIIKNHILEIIKDSTEEYSGIGRTSIISQLKIRGICLSDDKARKMLSSMQDEGLISIGKGRQGCRILPQDPSEEKSVNF
jgi:transcriptional regulator with PAS, ATPase and Fis domain